MTLLSRAQAGDDAAFGELVEPFRRELQVHCYRMLGSVQDAEDVLQETLTAAWRGLGGFGERASLRTWLYRIATNRCLNWLRDGQRRPRTVPALPAGVAFPEPTRTVEPVWLQPIPDTMLAGLPDDTPGPEARYERREAVSLAFVTAVQTLPPRQRAVLLLRDVLGYRAAEAAELLDMTEDAANGLLKRARSVQFDRGATPSPRERQAASAFATAIEAGDVDAMVALLTDDAWLTMPPAPLEYQGHAAIAGFMSRIALREGHRRYRLIPAPANLQPAYGCYVSDDGDPVGHAHGVMVLTVTGDRVSAVTRFVDTAVMPYFGLPRRL